MSYTYRFAVACMLLSFCAVSSAISCWKCGQYSDGVGSITPCNNRSAARLEVCPAAAKYCIRPDYSSCTLLGGRISDTAVVPIETVPCCRDLPPVFGFYQGFLDRQFDQNDGVSLVIDFRKKYVSELTVVRDCVPTCSEKEWWGARTFCCDTDECNSAPRSHVTATAIIAVVLSAIAVAR